MDHRKSKRITEKTAISASLTTLKPLCRSQVYAPTINAEEAKVEQFYEDLQDLLELIPKKDVLFIIGDWNAKVGSQEFAWSNRQIWPWDAE